MSGAVVSVRARQDPLRALYREEPKHAWIVGRARTVWTDAADPFHSAIELGSAAREIWDFGVHRAVGGPHDSPVPGDILCAALASCLESTIRQVANRYEVELTSLTVEVRGHVDVRGTLAVDREVPVGFQRLECDVRARVPPGADLHRVERVMITSERCCVVLQTLRGGVPVHVERDVAKSESTPSEEAPA